MIAPSHERQFTRARETYESSTATQKIVAQELVRRVGLGRKVLEIGAGTGYATRLLGEKFPESHITALDISPGMLETLRRQMGKRSPVEIVCGDFLDLRGEPRFDLIVSSSCLQWIASLASAFQRMNELLLGGGLVHFAIMTKGTLAELRELRNELFPGLSPRRELPGRDQISRDLSASGLRILEMTERTYVEERKSAWDLFRDLRSSGLTGGELCLGARPLLRGELARLADVYEQRFRGESGGVFSTYRVLFVEAKK